MRKTGYGAYGNVMLDDVYVYGKSTSAYRAATMDIWNQGNGRTFGYGKTFKIILSLCALLFIMSFIPVEDSIIAKCMACLKTPLLSLIIVKINLFVFVKLMGRYPENTFGSLTSKPWQDVVFCFLTFVQLGFLLALVVYLHILGLY